MKASVIVPVGDMAQWKHCEVSIINSIVAAPKDIEFEVLPCFDLEHKGAYLARNEGLAKAKGDWIAWVDCDDEVEPCWASEIVAAIKSHPEVDVIQYDAIEVRGSKTRPLRYGCEGEVSGEQFARELLRNDGMPAWLWTRVFRKELFDGLQFEGRVKQDYRMFLSLLPRVKRVWPIAKPLYRYIKHGHGLSNYTQDMDYAQAGKEFDGKIETLPDTWRHDSHVGLALTMADVAIHSKCDNGSRQWVRRFLGCVLKDRHVPMRLKIKAFLAAIV